MQFIKKKEISQNETSLFRTSAGVRTLDPLIKSQMLYQLSYRRIVFLLNGFNSRFAAAKVASFVLTAKFFPDFFCFNFDFSG